VTLGTPRTRTALLLTAYAVLALVVALAPSLGPLAAGLVLAGEAAVGRTDPRAEKVLAAAGAEAGVRCLVRGGLLTVAVVRAADLPAVLVAGLLAVVFALALAPVAGQILARRAEIRINDQVRWQGLDVGGRSSGPAGVPLPGDRVPPSGRGEGNLPAELLLVAAAAVVVLVPWSVGRWTLAAALAAVAVGTVLRLLRVLRYERAAASAPNAAVLPRLVAALEELAPTVVVYFSSPVSGSYALRVWVEVLRRLDERVVVLLREADHLEQVDLSGLPVVVLPAAQHVEQARVPSMRLVLYPTNVMKNNHMVRLPDLRHVFIGHGDSDKAGSASPVSRVYDEIWVAGEAGRDRYVVAAEGVRPEQVRIVSRPQLAGLAHAVAHEAGDLPTVLYAPTWEGFFDRSDYCSVVAPGLDAVRTMVASGRVRVLFKPHPATGQRRADAAAAVAEIERLVAAAPHDRLPDAPEALYDGMRRADVLLSDVSSVLSDWLASRRPYVVANPQGWSHAEMHERFPTTRGGSVLDDGRDVLAVLDEALGPDALADRRAELATYLLGPQRDDPVADFVAEVSAAVDRAAPAVAAAAARSEGAP
jgi:hypothetical protein